MEEKENFYLLCQLIGKLFLFNRIQKDRTNILIFGASKFTAENIKKNKLPLQNLVKDIYMITGRIY
jgi:hypothetical protein